MHSNIRTIISRTMLLTASAILMLGCASEGGSVKPITTHSSSQHGTKVKPAASNAKGKWETWHKEREARRNQRLKAWGLR